MEEEEAATRRRRAAWARVRMAMMLLVMMVILGMVTAPVKAAVRKKGPGASGGGILPPLFPPVEEVASRAAVWANATCGADGPQRFCRPAGAGAGAGGGEQCDVCDARSPARAHPPEAALGGAGAALAEGGAGWWQSPSLAEGDHFERVTFTLDLQREYEVAHVSVRAGPAPLPAVWALERSLDGAAWRAWRLFAPSDADCWAEFGAPAHANAADPDPDPGDAPDADADAPCSVAPPGPLDGGEVHVSILPSPSGLSPAAQSERTRARYVRLRMLRLRSPAGDPSSRFYALRAVRVGARCACGGHASECTPQPLWDQPPPTPNVDTAGGEWSSALALQEPPRCACRRGSCGPSCERCCALHNQRPWRYGAPCEPCQCHGHAFECHFDAAIAAARRSLDAKGRFLGGGVCLNCTDHTAGVNCERCADGFFRPGGVRPDAASPCEACACSGPGATGRCAADEHDPLGREPGTCECRAGFAGARCERCAAGHRGWPACSRCPCDARGADAARDACDADGRCLCKANVEGEQCERCRASTFGLSADDPLGCARCVCSGVSDSCHSAAVSFGEESSLGGWLLSDLSVTRTATPTQEGSGSGSGGGGGRAPLSVAAGELPGVEALFWLAPAAWSGARLAAYGRNISFSVAWAAMRGDTSGKPTVGPNVVLVGANGVRLAYGHVAYRRAEASITVPLWAPDDPSAPAPAGATAGHGAGAGWFHLPPHVTDIPARPGRRPDHRGARASRADLLSVLADLRHVLLRASYHTDQVEGSLRAATLRWGSSGAAGLENVRVERCDCPPGYEGLSCERCAFGYVRVPSERATGSGAFECRRCECNGHAASCDPHTGACTECLHNTMGKHCEFCKEGFFGNASQGLVTDCHLCACPNEDPTFSFSPTCIATPSGGHMCTACVRGHTGPHCERCEPGYFGNPREQGGSCKPCICGGGPCDTETGQCLKCPGNTEGWNCERCLPAHYGDPAAKDCKACNCFEAGSLTVSTCDRQTGQCQCRPQFTGRTCDQCKSGYGNISAGCPPCSCDSVGAASKMCDPDTGQCTCLPGVTGAHCNLCQHQHFGFSSSGCESCGCHPAGALEATCDIVTGQCRCRAGVEGRACDRCRAGHWGLATRGRCEPCACDPLGAHAADCDQRSGQCRCRPGVAGPRCDACLPKHFGFSHTGCRPCEVCDRPGRVCDPDTGRCVCPPLTEGAACERCSVGAWGHDPHHGCKACDCEAAGAAAVRCDARTGRCLCREAFAGARCERCADAHHGWPACRRCACHAAGTRADACAAPAHPGALPRCRCAPDGSCACKANAEGRQCDRCRAGTFGLSADNPDGCTRCFCFGRSTACTQAGLAWSQLLAMQPRAARVGPAGADPRDALQRVPGGLLAAPAPPAAAAPAAAADAALHLRGPLPAPLYWALPAKFHGDRVLSYGGVISFSRSWEGGSITAPGSYPLVQLQGNGLVLQHYSLLPPTSERQGVRLHESLWQLRNEQHNSQQVTREILMLALQNVEHVLVQASPLLDFDTAVIQNVSLDTAVEAPGQPPSARGIELCSCPPEYNSTSCQDPSIGFYRWYSGDPRKATIVIQLIGEARPCECNRRSRICNIETGHCLNCSENTGGPHCERCADGYYGNPDIAPCQPCPCPTPHRNFALSCHVTSRDVTCHCRPGYTGPRCDRCAYGWFGFPREEGGSCTPCQCNPHGSVSDECDEETGQCNCRVGITGRDCSYCQDWHVLTEHGCQSCNDSCTGVLLSEIEGLTSRLAQNTHHIVEGDIPPPWQTLYDIRDSAMRLEERLQEWLNTVNKVDGFPISVVEELKRKAKSLINKAKKLIKFGDRNTEDSYAVKNEAYLLLDEIKKLQKDTNDIVQGLKNYGQVHAGEVSIENALQEAQHLASEIRKRNGTINTMKTAAVNALRKCEDILDRIRKLLEGGPEIGPLKQGLEILTSRLDSLLDTLHGTSEVLAKTQSFTNKNREILKTSNMNVDQILDLEGEVEVLSDEAKFLVENAKSFLENATTNMKLMEENMITFANLMKQVKEREGILQRLNPLYHDQYVLKAQLHADLLWKRAQQYRDLFNSTRREADFALRASRAYQSIVDAINTARESAMNASFAGDIAYKTAYPGSQEMSLLDHAREIGEKSEVLLKKAEEELVMVNNVKQDYENAKAKISGVKYSIKAAEEGNKHILEELKKLKRGELQRQVEEAMMRAETAVKVSREANATAAKISSDVKNKLKPLLATLSQDELLASHTEKLMAAQKNIMNIKELLERMNQRSNDEKKNFNRWNNTMASRLHELRSKITQTRHTAEGIHLSLTSGPMGGCIRSYRLPYLTPSTTNSIILNYAIDSDEEDASLFYLANEHSREFMALEMVNRSIRFVWNAGGGVGVVVHPQKIEKAMLHEDKNWYRIQVERTSNIATLSVRQQILPEGSAAATGYPVSNSSEPGYGIVDVQPGDHLWIGGLPPGTISPPQLMANSDGLVGCLHRVILDGRQIGLWNFVTETKSSCSACIEGVQETKDESAYRFSGDGYSMHTIDSFDSADKYQFSISLKFKTLDENAILFLAVDKQKTRFVALFLENGHLVFRIGYGRSISLQLKTITKVNTGNWVSCEAVRVFEDERRLESALLSIDGESNQSSPSEPPTRDDIPDLEEFFLGGVPPGFQMNVNVLVLPVHFLGCMSDIQLSSGGINPLVGKFYGVEASCAVSYTSVSFHGQGFLELTSHPLKKKESSFEFVFRSRQRNALLMLTKGYEKGDYYSASLHDGRVVIWVSSGRTKTILHTKKEYNDGKFHALTVTKKNKKLTLRVDEEDHGTAIMQGGDYQVRVTSPSDPKKTSRGGLFFGGYSADVPEEPEVASYVPLIGTIKDVIFNNQLLRFEDQVGFHRADIGRLGPWELRESQEASLTKTHVPTQCHKVPHYSVEPQAVKFGDSPESYVRITRRASNLQKNFSIEFSFRTYYPSGLLLIVPIQRKKESHFMIALHNKYLYVELKGRKKSNKIIGHSELNDGMWHHVTLKRMNRNLSLIVNENNAGKCKLPKKFTLGSVFYVGGLPPNTTFVPNIPLETFKGCVRRLTINNVEEPLVGPNTQTKNVRQCYPSVERGAYFPGDAYALYDNQFQIRSLQELELEFKTSELTGVLLSVAEPSGVPAISLELNNGKVVIRCDSGDRKPVQVEQSFPSKYMLCDNNWHSIHATFLSSGLFLKVDNLPNVTGLSSNGAVVVSHTSSSLYIGGVPENFTGGTLITRDHFKGCIRNIVVGRRRKDWTDMTVLENVHLNSCPISD